MPPCVACGSTNVEIVDFDYGGRAIYECDDCGDVFEEADVA